MKWMIASDIHGSAYWCGRMLEAFEKEGAEKLVLLGDLLYHGPRNDLPKEYDPKEVLRMLNERSRNIFCVRGNCDSEVDQMVLGFPILADYAVFYWEGRMIYACHGHHRESQCDPYLRKGDILLTGHTHIPAWKEEESGYWYGNPGSVALPKENSAHSYLILEGKRISLKTMDGEIIWSESIC